MGAFFGVSGCSADSCVPQVQKGLVMRAWAVRSPRVAQPRRRERRLHQRFHRRSHEILVPRQQAFQVDNFRLTLALRHGVHPARVGGVEHHQHAMTAHAAVLIAEPSAHYL
jgi:hypothetical protein